MAYRKSRRSSGYRRSSSRGKSRSYGGTRSRRSSYGRRTSRARGSRGQQMVRIVLEHPPSNPMLTVPVGMRQFTPPAPGKAPF